MFAPSGARLNVGRQSLKFTNDNCLERDLIPVPPRGQFVLAPESVRLGGGGGSPSSRSVPPAWASVSPVFMGPTVSSKGVLIGALSLIHI